MQPPPRQGGATHPVHVGRQPIYDVDGKVVAFELLFRENAAAAVAQRDDSSATALVIINAFSEFGMADIVGDRVCFVNLTREFIVGKLPLPFGPEHAVLEILETVEVDDALVAAVAGLAEQGYGIALDDFRHGSGHERLLPLASVVKLDLLDTPIEELREVARITAGFPHITLLGEKLETEEHISTARALGCTLFQGYALSRPTIVSTAALSPSRTRQIELLAALSRRDPDVADIVRMVSSEPALSLRLLRLSNSAGLGTYRRVSSVHEAVMLLGLRRIREWVALMVVSDVTGNVDESQLTASVARARMCQHLAESTNVSGETAFTAGLLSGIADLLGTPLPEMLAGLPLAEDLADALLRGEGRLGRILDAVDAYERADLGGLEQSGIPQDSLVGAYLSAAAWSTRTVRSILEAAPAAA